MIDKLYELRLKNKEYSKALEANDAENDKKSLEINHQMYCLAYNLLPIQKGPLKEKSIKFLENLAKQSRYLRWNIQNKSKE